MIMYFIYPEGNIEVKNVLVVAFLGLLLSSGLTSAEEGPNLLEEIQAQSANEHAERFVTCVWKLLEATDPTEILMQHSLCRSARRAAIDNWRLYQLQIDEGKHQIERKKEAQEQPQPAK
jgi:hypothetical protein